MNKTHVSNGRTEPVRTSASQPNRAGIEAYRSILFFIIIKIIGSFTMIALNNVEPENFVESGEQPVMMHNPAGVDANF